MISPVPLPLLLAVYSVWLSQAAASLPSPPSYVFSMAGGICVYNSTSPVLDDPQMTCLVQYTTNMPLYLDLNLDQNLIYFSHQDDIYQIGYEKGATATTLMNSAGTISDLSFDWISGNLYFVDQALGAVRVMTSQGDHTVTLIKGVTGIRTVVVDPINRYLFWMKRVRARYTYSIGRSRLNGSDRNDDFYTDLNSPTYMVLDHQQERIYWADTIQGSIESMDFKGENHQVLFKEVDKYPYSLAVDQNYVIWLDNTKHNPSVYWTDKTSGNHSQVDTHQRFNTAVNDILVFGEYSQPRGYTNSCSDNNGGCSHLCFAVSDTDRKCLCSMGFVLEDDGTSCEPAARGDLKDNLVIADAARGGIYFLNTATQSVSALGIPRQTVIQSVTVDEVNEYVFWANTALETIERARLDGSEVTVIKTFEQGHTIIGLAVDPLEEQMFYCDIQAGVTSSLSYSGSSETLLLPENDTVAIVPDTLMKQVYLAISGSRSRISRISYDGSTETTLIADVSWPLSLAVDFQEGKMYWVDYFNQFEWSDLDGRNRYTKFIPWYSAFLSMTILGNFIYIADWGSNENQVGRLEKENPKTFEGFGPDEFLHVTKIASIATGTRSASSTPSEFDTTKSVSSTSTQSITTQSSTTGNTPSITTMSTTSKPTLLTPKPTTANPTTPKPTTPTAPKPTTPIATTQKYTTPKPTTPTAEKPTTPKPTTPTTQKPITPKPTTPTTQKPITPKPTIPKPTTPRITTSIAQTSKYAINGLTLSTTTDIHANNAGTSTKTPTLPNVLPPRGSPTSLVSGTDKLTGEEESGPDLTPTIGGALGGILVVILAIVSVTVCVVLRNKRKLPPSDMVINNMAFENPEYAEYPIPICSPSVSTSNNRPVGVPVRKSSILGAGHFPVSYHDNRRSISGYSKFPGSFCDDASAISNHTRYSHRSNRGSGSNYGESSHGNGTSVRGGSKRAASVHSYGSVAGSNSGSFYGRSSSHVYESLPSMGYRH